MIPILVFVAAIVLFIIIYMRQAKFGTKPSGKRLEAIQAASNYSKGKFQNIHFTPPLAEDTTMPKVLYEFLFRRKPNRTPVDIIPSVKTNLLNLPPEKNVLVWFGHSSYFIQVNGKTFLIDPVFSGNASPIPGSNKAFKGSDIYTVDDLPAIDYLLITHDHYDHLDYETVIKLKTKTKKVICGLGVASHLEYWGYAANTIIEKNWNEKIELENGMTLYTAPARHFSGRGFVRNNTLWLSFILQTPTMKLYLGGDSGYDTHFKTIGDAYGPFDLVLLDNGQYDIKWKYIHMLPEEVLKAAQDLKAKKLFPVHSSKFAMSNHPWNEPLSKVTALNKSTGIPMITPMIGEAVNLDDKGQTFTNWWEGLR